MVKKGLAVLALACGFLGANYDQVGAQPIGGGGGGGGGNYDCAICWHGGGWSPGTIHWTTCSQTPNGGAGGCTVVGDQCYFSRGCVSLPDDIGGIGYIP